MNQNPEQLARDRIDDQLIDCGWTLQDKKSFNLAAGIGVAIREYQTDAGPADYILFVNRKPVGLIEAKRGEEGVRLTMVEEQSTEYGSAKLKYINNDTRPCVFDGERVSDIVCFKEQPIFQEIESSLSVCVKIEETKTESLKQAEALRQSILKTAFEGGRRYNLAKKH